MKSSNKHPFFLSIVVALLLFTAHTAAAQSSSSDSYSVVRGKAYYRQTPVAMVDIPSFRILGHGYAVDRYHVYLNGEVLEFVDPSTFRLTDGPSARRPGDYPRWMDDECEDYESLDGRFVRHNRYFKSSHDVFYGDRVVSGASASSFEDLGCGYAKDAFNVYYRGRRVDGASANSFKVLGRGYGEDAFDTYYQGKRVGR